jgi:hypothetical protein
MIAVRIFLSAALAVLTASGTQAAPAPLPKRERMEDVAFNQLKEDMKEQGHFLCDDVKQESDRWVVAYLVGWRRGQLDSMPIYVPTSLAPTRLALFRYLREMFLSRRTHQ